MIENNYSAREIFPKRLREVRIMRQITQTDLAKHLGIKESIVEKYETGRTLPRLSTLISIVHFLKIPVDYLLGLKDSF